MSSRIFIIDDEPNNIEILRIFLSSLQYEIVFTHSGKAALSMIDDVDPDLILLDVMMPEMNGFQVFKHWLKRNDFDIPVIYLSANAQKEHILQGLQLGAFDYLTKPFDLDLLERKVAFALEQKMKLKNLKNDNERLAAKVYVDALTGLYNRAYLDTTIRMIEEGIKKFNAAIMVDVDQFKMINDTYGHLAGDRALREVADIIIANIGSSEGIVFRYGGDEYLILLHDEAACHEVADRLIKAVEDLTIMLSPQHSLKVSISIGVANSLDEWSFEQWISHADFALLAAKKSGKHAIRMHELKKG